MRNDDIFDIFWTFLKGVWWGFCSSVLRVFKGVFECFEVFYRFWSCFQAHSRCSGVLGVFKGVLELF